MADEIVKASVVFGPGGGGGVAGALSGAGDNIAQGGRNMAKALNLAVTLPITDVLGTISKSMSKLVAFSPLLQAESIRFRKAMQLILMPIGNAMATSLRPFANAWLKSARKFYADYESGGLMTAFANASLAFFQNLGWVDSEGKISFEGILENMDELGEITGTMLLTTAAIAGGVTLATLMASNIKGMTVRTGGGLAVTGALLLVAAETTDGGIESMIANMAAIGVGYGIISGNPYLTVASAIVFSKSAFEDEWADASQWIIDAFSDVGEFASDAFWNTFGQQGFLTKGFDAVKDFFMGREGGTSMIADLETDTLTLGERVEEMPPLWERIWTGITDTLGITVKPALDDMGVQLDDNTTKVQDLSSDLIALPNINRTITYTIKYKKA